MGLGNKDVIGRRVVAGGGTYQQIRVLHRSQPAQYLRQVLRTEGSVDDGRGLH
jgi:hypothetical protein